MSLVPAAATVGAYTRVLITTVPFDTADSENPPTPVGRVETIAGYWRLDGFKSTQCCHLQEKAIGESVATRVFRIE